MPELSQVSSAHRLNLHSQYVCSFFADNYSIFLCCSRCCNTNDKTTALSCQGPIGRAPYAAGFGDYCPSPPLLSVSDAYNQSISGPLDSDNTFVAEYLIEVADKLQPSVFFQEVQAGFVVSYQEPPITFCRLGDMSHSVLLSGLLGALYNMSAFSFPNPECNGYIRSCNSSIGYFGTFNEDCVRALECVNSSNYNITSIPGDYYDYLPSDTQSVIEDTVCSKYQQSGAAKVYPDQDDSMTVTIWYNNQVSKNREVASFPGLPYCTCKSMIIGQTG